MERNIFHSLLCTKEIIMDKMELKYLEKLAELYPTIASASTEVINLQSILNLPKGTEHFLSDVHGEHEAFAHVLKNGSGFVRRKISDIFGHTLSQQDKQSLATLIYYPREKMDMILKGEESPDDWYRITLYRLVEVCKRVSSKYTRSKVRKSLPPEFAYVIEELITEKVELVDKENYYNVIIDTIIETQRAEEFIVAISELIQRLIIDHLHIVGDIYDRGPGPHIIMDQLLEYHSVDIQWGNHDVLWMGAAAGQPACIANVIRICARYGNLDILEDGYGINLLPLATYAMHYYGDDPCTCFKLKNSGHNDLESRVNLMMHKAITILQFKLEGNVIDKRSEFQLEGRKLLHKIDFEKQEITIDGECYPMKDTQFPTVNLENPYELTEEEQEIMERLVRGFVNCEKLQNHMRFLLAKGGLYKVYNDNLLYHGCVLLNESGELKSINLAGQTYKGKDWYDALDSYIRKGFFATNKKEREFGKDMMWYVWLHENSPLFGKNKMATFERYFIEDKKAQSEVKNPYYHLLEKQEIVNQILEEFSVDIERGHIVNGHVPVKSSQGESPVKCDGKVLVIDGGFSKAYHKETGIAGYTLIYNSYGMILVAHKPFESTEEAIEKESDIHSDNMIIKRVMNRKIVADTDNGRKIQEKINELYQLLDAYRCGLIIENDR